MTIPLDQGFTVVTGPNGSGKSNILDGILFCLGLATSKGMRADRLPDLVNSGVLKAGKSAETFVSVRFDLTDWEPDAAEEGLEPAEEGPWIKSDQKEWTVTRRLRIMPGGSYSSSYTADGEPCNLQQLQTQLRRLRVDPEGSNVVMQGDVTRIVSMSNKDRRGLIDELAGVALFDNRIEQTRLKLDSVHEKQERCRIVEQELLGARQRLEKDCDKARIYKELKEKVQIEKKQEQVLTFEAANEHLDDLKIRYKKLGEKDSEDSKIILNSEEILAKSIEKLDILQKKVKALGEDELLKVQAQIAGLDTQSRELERQFSIYQQEGEKLKEQRTDILNRRSQIKQDRDQKLLDFQSNNLDKSESKCKEAEAAVEIARRRLADIAGRSGAWVEDQLEYTNSKKKLQIKLDPLVEHQNQLQEDLLQLNTRLEELASDKKRDSTENEKIIEQINSLDKEWENVLNLVANKKKDVQIHDESLAIQTRTRSRLEQEQARIEKEIARLESRRETLQESRGTGALRMLLESGLDGIHGPVAQLGEVDDSNRLALEVAAGARMGHIVVDDDLIAAKAIEILKKRKAGRLTFLPLNKIKSGNSSNNQALQRTSFKDQVSQNNGLIGKAFDLIKHEPIYNDVFIYVFGETLVFKDLNSARISLGLKRSVTLDGELLDKSGAMTGGSFSGRGVGLRFGISKDNDDLEPMRLRLLELGETLLKCISEESRLKDLLINTNSQLVKLDQRKVALEAERIACKRAHGPLIEHQQKRIERFNGLKQKKEDCQNAIASLSQEINPLTIEFNKLEKQGQLLENNVGVENWQKLQLDLESADLSLSTIRKERDELLNEQSQQKFSLDRLKDQEKILDNEETRLKEAVNTLSISHKDWKNQTNDLHLKSEKLQLEQRNIEKRFGEERRSRDSLEADVSNQRNQLQEAQWNLERLREERNSVDEELRSETIRVNELEKKLPNPLPVVSEEVRSNGLESLKASIESMQSRMEALEPVNMLALEELSKLEKRLEELVQRLEVLTEERSELLLRIETVATLRQEAFMEAFQAVDIHFREIFASLSDGDGHLQLDNAEDPLEGGLTLVAHPKGKAVRRLAAMSGGEKSLTALSFLFALQRFRPSPFYALDEVDSFLDGVNVERLSALIAKQADHAQFLVVSHRRPMIGASSRTIGVTQARGANTQVVGLPLAA